MTIKVNILKGIKFQYFGKSSEQQHSQKIFRGEIFNFFISKNFSGMHFKIFFANLEI